MLVHLYIIRASQYIDYEKLKAILKRAKVSAANRDALIKRIPAAVVAEVAQERKDRSRNSLASNTAAASVPIAQTETVEYTTPLKVGRYGYPLEVSSAKNSLTSLHSAPNSPADATPLLGATSPIKRQNSWGSLGLRVTSYLGLADDRALLIRTYDDADDRLNLFIETYNQEIKKVNDFTTEKTDELSQRMEVLVESVDTSGLKKMKHKHTHSLVESITKKFESMMHNTSKVMDFQMSESLEDEFDENHPDGGDLLEKQKKKDDILRKSDSIKRAITDIYRTSKLLHNYSIMNYTGFVKIAKKFDKTFPEHKGIFKGNNCDDGKQAEQLANKMESIYSKWFCEGDIREAQAQMLPKRGDGLLTDWTQLRLGYRLGMCSILAMWIAWDCVWGQIHNGEVSIGGRSAFPVFRACFGLLIWHWFWGMAVYVWTRFRINYIYLFDFDPRNVDTPLDIFNDAVDETLVFLVCMLMYYKSDVGDMPLWVPPRAYPTFLILYTVKCLIFPWKMRKPLWIAIKQVLMAPFVPPTFFLTYVGDVFTRYVYLLLL